MPTLLFQLKMNGGASTGGGGGVSPPVGAAALGSESFTWPSTRNSSVRSEATPPSAPKARTVTGTVEPCTTVMPLMGGSMMLTVGKSPVAVNETGADATALPLSSVPMATIVYLPGTCGV